MKRNKGFSLLELIVVISLIGIVLGVLVVRVDRVFGFSAKEARSKLYTSLESLQVSCLSKETTTATTVAGANVYMEIYQKDGLHYLRYCEHTKELSNVQLGPKRISIQYSLDSSPASYVNITGTTKLRLSYNRSTGAFLPISGGASPRYVKWIVVSGGEKTYKIELMPKTGKLQMVNN